MAGPGGRLARGWRCAAVFLLLVLTSVACTREESPLEPAAGESRTVSFESPDGVRLEGRLFGEGRVGVVLAHMFPADQSSWYEFADVLADRGYSALTFNFRGYCPGGDDGCSEGSRDFGVMWKDVVGAVRFLRSQEGVEEVAIGGASMGGTAALIALARGDVEAAAIVTLSAPEKFEGLVAEAPVLQAATEPKLFLAGLEDTSAAQSAERFYNEAVAPKRVEILPVGDHGTDLLWGERGEVARNLVLGYLEQHTSGS